MRLRAALERWLEDIWYGDRPVPAVLAALEPLYRRLARSGARPSARPPRPVIVVGNLVAGGCGKTPVVIELARQLQAHSLRVAVIARGHGARQSGRAVRVRPDDRSERVGDEALEIAQAVDVPVWVARRRGLALDAALADGAEVVLSDDGLQHEALPRSFELCLIDGRRCFGNGRMLPAGPLRQPPARLADVDLVLWREPRPAERADTLGFSIELGALRPAHPGSGTAPAPPAAIDAVAGIADPEPFFAALEARGYRVRRHRFGDHQAIPRRWLKSLAGPVVTTAKDCARIGKAPRHDLHVLPVQARLPARAVDRILAHVREFRP